MWQNNLTWHNSNTAGISLDSRLKYGKITHRYAKHSPFTWLLYWKSPTYINFYLFYLSLSPVLWHACQRMSSWASCTSARDPGCFDCLVTSHILITMDNSRGFCAWWKSYKSPDQTHREIKRKMYAIKQIKICVQYQDMLPRPRLDLSSTPGSWQTSLGRGSMSWYSAHIFICITWCTAGLSGAPE